MKCLPISLLCLLSLSVYAGDTTSHKRIVKRWPIWFTPSKADVINGITLSPIESTYFFNDKPQKCNGLVIHGIGIMLLALIAPGDPNEMFVRSHKQLSEDELLAAKIADDRDSSNSGIDCNGLLISGTGTITKTCNGVNISAWCGRNLFSNGIFINAFLNWNYHLKGMAAGIVNSSFDVRGVQIGLTNYTHNLKGFQIGLWNENKHRSRSLINWNF